MIYAYRPIDKTRYPINIGVRAPETLKTWLKYFPEAQPVECDEEDWIENASILESADKAGIPLTILDRKKSNLFISGDSWNVPSADENAPDTVMLGTWTNRDRIEGLPFSANIIGSDARSVKAAGNYAQSKTFRKYAGRPIVVTSGDIDTDDGIEAGLRTVTRKTGTGKVFLKTVFKAWATTFDIDLQAESYWRDICRKDEERGGDQYGLAWFPVENEGFKNRLIIQGQIAPRFEYRMVVIDGRIVTGSGCIEAYTPAENTAIFDPQMEEVRSDGNVVIRKDIVERYLQFAKKFVAEFAEENGEGLDYSLDLCIDENTGNVVPVELNPPFNLGAYARNNDAWLGAIIERAKRIEEGK